MMRVLLAIVVLALICTSMVWANGVKVTPPPETGAGPSTPPCVCPPLPATISAGTTTVPMDIPVLINKCVLNTVPCQPNVSVLVPTTVDCTMANQILANNNLAIVMVPVTIPVVASQQVVSRMTSGAGPCPIAIDQSGISALMNTSNIVIVPLSNPVPFDQNMLNLVNTSQAIMMQQSSFSKIATSGQPVLIVPMAVPAPIAGSTVAGRGPSQTYIPLTKDAAARVLSTGTVWVATQMNRPTLSSMITSNNVQFVVPMMVPMAPSGTASTGAAGSSGTSTTE